MIHIAQPLVKLAGHLEKSRNSPQYILFKTLRSRSTDGIQRIMHKANAYKTRFRPIFLQSLMPGSKDSGEIEIYFRHNISVYSTRFCLLMQVNRRRHCNVSSLTYKEGYYEPIVSLGCPPFGPSQ